MKFNRDMLFAAGTVIAIVIAVVVAVLLFGGISKFSSAEKTLQASIKRLRMFYTEDPFPSDANVQREKQSADRLREWFDKLTRSLREGEVAPDPADTSPSRWTTMYGTKRSELKKKASDRGVALPTDFAFGFEEYAMGTPPPPPDVPLLTQHLKIVDSLCSLLIEEGAVAIQGIKREAVGEARVAGLQHTPTTGAAGGGGGLVGAPPPRRPPDAGGRRRSASVMTAGPGAVAARVTEPAGPLYAKQHFELDFSARERTVLAILNRLARSPALTVVTSVEMVRDAEDILKAEATIRVPPGGGIPLAEMKSDDYPSSIERMVCGAEIEKPMRVKMKLNVYNFLGE